MNPHETRRTKNPPKEIMSHFVSHYQTFKEGYETPIETDWSKKMDEDIEYMILRNEALSYIQSFKNLLEGGRPFVKFNPLGVSMEKPITDYINKLLVKIKDNNLTVNDLRLILSPL